MKHLRSCAVFLFGFLSLGFIFTAGIKPIDPVSAFGNKSTLEVDFKTNEELPPLLFRETPHVVGYLTLKETGDKISLSKIVFYTNGVPANQVIRRAWLVNELGQKIGSQAAISPETLIFQNWGSFTIKNGETHTLALEIEPSTNARFGDAIGFDLRSSKHITPILQSNYDEVDIIGNFPMHVDSVMLTDAQTPTFLQFIVSSTDGSVAQDGIIADTKDVLLSELHLTVYGEEDASLSRLAFRRNGSMDASAIRNFRLADESGMILAQTNQWDNNKIIFQFQLTLIRENTKTLRLLADIADQAEPNDTIQFEIETPIDIDLFGETNGESIRVMGTFPIRTSLKTVLKPAFYVTIPAESLDSELLLQGQQEVVLTKFIFTAGVEPVEMRGLTLRKTGNAPDESLRDLHLTNDSGAPITSLQSLNAGLVHFPVEWNLSPGEQKTVWLRGDLAGDAPPGTALGFQISTAEDIELAKPQTILVPGKFPLKSGVYTLATTTGIIFPGARMQLTLEPYTPTGENFMSGVSDTPLLKLHFKDSTNPLQINKLRFAVEGSISDQDISNFRLIDQFHDVVAGPENILSGSVTFENPFGVERGEDLELMLIADLSATATAGKKMRFTIPLPHDVTVQTLDTDKPAEVLGSFPLQAYFYTITTPPAEDYVRLSVPLTPSRTLLRGEQDVPLFYLSFLAHGEDIKINRLLFHQTGTALDALHFFELYDEAGNKLTSEKMMTAENIVLEEPIRVAKGQEKRLTLKADVRDNIPLGKVIQLELSGTDSIRAATISGADAVETIANFPIRTGMFPVSAETAIEVCTQEFLPVCGIKYDTCEERPCTPVQQTYPNRCHLEADTALFIADGDCASLPKNDTPPPVYSFVEEEETDAEDIVENPFPDVEPLSLEGKAARFLERNNIINGYPDGTFGGDNLVNRAEFTKFLLLARYGEIPTGTTPGRFSDVAGGEWFAEMVGVAAGKGIINGYPDGSFRPSDGIKRAEFLKMLSIAFGIPENLPYSYTDVPENEWFTKYVGAAAYFQLFPGTGSKLYPAQAMTRNELAVAIYLYLKNRETI